MSATARPSPVITRRADPHVLRHTDGHYYFTASVPDYDGVELRRSPTLAGLARATPKRVWRKPDRGPLADLIWAPEIHHHDGRWYVYFAAAPSREIRDGLFQHRMYAISCAAENPVEAAWDAPVRIDSGIDAFCLDATTFRHRGQLYYVWAQKHPDILGNSNLCLARMANPLTLATAPVVLSRPEYDWETRGFLVNEGPAVLIRGGRIFISYSASATDARYCMGLLETDADADLLNAASWKKSPVPVLATDPERGIFGPGHNSFTVTEDGGEDVLVYHARTYTDIVGDPLWDPNRHTFMKRVNWSAEGRPSFDGPHIAP